MDRASHLTFSFSFGGSSSTDPEPVKPKAEEKAPVADKPKVSPKASPKPPPKVADKPRPVSKAVEEKPVPKAAEEKPVPVVVEEKEPVVASVAPATGATPKGSPKSEDGESTDSPNVARDQ